MSSRDNDASSSGSGQGRGGSSSTNWDPYLRHSSAIGIVKPSVFDVYNTSGSSSSRYGGTSGGSSSYTPSRVARTDQGSYQSDEFVTPLMNVNESRSGGGPGLGARVSVLDERLRVVQQEISGTPTATGETAEDETTPTAANVVSSAADVTTSTARDATDASQPAARLVLVDLVPGATWTSQQDGVDYVVVLAGEVTLRFRDEERAFGRGEIVIASRSLGVWVNRATGMVRMVVTMLAAQRQPESQTVDASEIVVGEVLGIV